MFRAEFHAALKGWPGLVAIDGVNQRVYQASSVDKHTPKPFIVVRMHTGFPVERSIGAREYSQIWVHDEPGSYLRIDEIIVQVRRAIEAIPPHDLFLEARWIESGVDLRDDVLETITRYCRFQTTQTLRELHA